MANNQNTRPLPDHLVRQIRQLVKHYPTHGSADGVYGALGNAFGVAQATVQKAAKGLPLAERTRRKIEQALPDLAERYCTGRIEDLTFEERLEWLGCLPELVIGITDTLRKAGVKNPTIPGIDKRKKRRRKSSQT